VTPQALLTLSIELEADAEYYVRMVSGDLHTGKILIGKCRDLVEMEIQNYGHGTHRIWLAIRHIESIQEQS